MARLGRALRYQILRRDNHRCRYCGATAPEARLTVDHVVPEALGGTNDPTNLVAACSDCNGGKSATPPDAAQVANVAEDALRWSRAVEAFIWEYGTAEQVYSDIRREKVKNTDPWGAELGQEEMLREMMRRLPAAERAAWHRIYTTREEDAEID